MRVDRLPSKSATGRACCPWPSTLQTLTLTHTPYDPFLALLDLLSAVHRERAPRESALGHVASTQVTRRPLQPLHVKPITQKRAPMALAHTTRIGNGRRHSCATQCLGLHIHGQIVHTAGHGRAFLSEHQSLLIGTQKHQLQNFSGS